MDEGAKEAIIPVVFNGKPHFPGKLQLARTLQVNEIVEKKLNLVALDDDPLQREWDEFVEDFPQCSTYLEPNFLEQNFPGLRKRVGSHDSGRGAEDNVVVYDVDVKEFQPEDINISVDDGVLAIVGKKEKILNDGGKYVKEELVGGIRVPEDTEADDVSLETTPEFRMRVSAPNSRPSSAMSSAPSSADTSLAER